MGYRHDHDKNRVKINERAPIVAYYPNENESLFEIAKKYGLPIIDLYSASVENAHLRKDDGVHFSAEGYKKFAELIVGELKKIK